jgi:hypothetical protein
MFPPRWFPSPFAGRFRILALILGTYLPLQALVRLGLLLFNGDWTLLAPSCLLPIVAMGLLFDLAVACWWLPPFALRAVSFTSSPRQAPIRAARGTMKLCSARRVARSTDSRRSESGRRPWSQRRAYRPSGSGQPASRR